MSLLSPSLTAFADCRFLGNTYKERGQHTAAANSQESRDTDGALSRGIQRPTLHGAKATRD